MDLQVIDRRPPLSAAISLAKAEHEGLLPKWRDDMAAMSAEVARKYFGALTEEAVRDGVDACVNLLSIGLLRSTSGGVDPAAWLQTLRATGVRGVSKLAVELIKACDALPDFPVVYAGKDEFRPSLLLLVLSQASRNGPNAAYNYLLRETAERQEVERTIKLAEWLFANTASGRIARRDLETFFGAESPEAEAAIHHILTLACGVVKVDPYAEPSTEDHPPEVFGYDLPVSRLPARALKEARQRYDELVARIPGELAPALTSGEKPWFDRFIILKSRAKSASGSGAQPH
ncbi:MAG TPA: hypothetical protein VF614_14955 [Chthoniobacteraceae bacterium]